MRAFASAHALALSAHACDADKAVVLHVSCAPLVLTLLAESDANVGLMVDTVPALTAAVEPLRQATALKVHM